MNWLVVFLVLLAVILVVGVQTHIFLRLRRYARRLERETTQQTKELLLYQALDIRHPLPPLRGWAISPDIGWIYVSKIFEMKPKTIVECGSGVSTLLAAYSLKHLGGGMVIALDHDRTFVEETTKQIRAHGLEGYAQVIYAPLVPHPNIGNGYVWYDLSDIALPPQIDLILVDGPPGHLQPISRLGALPLLQKHLHNQSALLLDDTQRPDEQIIIARWMVEFPLKQTIFKAEKGAVLLMFKPSSQPQAQHQERPELA